MKRTYSFFAWIVSSILLAGTASAQSPCLDALSPAWVHLLANHPALQSAEAKRASQQASLDAAQAAKLPRLDASASYQLNSAVPKLHLEIPLATGQTMVVDRDMGDHDRAELGVTASYAVFTGFAQTRREEAQKFSLDVAQLESANTRNALGLRFGLLHLGIQAARHNLELQILHTGVLHAHVQTLESQERAGVVLPAQKLAALADLARASADSLEAVRRLDSLRQEFLALSGASYPDALLTDSGNCPTADSSTLTPKSLAAEILETQALALGKSGEAATATRYPSLAIFAGYRYGNPGLNQFETEWMGYGLLGAQLQWNLFDGFERKATQARFAADARTLLAEAARVRLDQEKSLATLQQEIGNIAAQRRSLQVGLDAATAARDAYRDALARGAASADDVRDAELRVDDISTQVELLAIRRSMLELRLAYASGQDIQFDFPKEP